MRSAPKASARRPKICESSIIESSHVRATTMRLERHEQTYHLFQLLETGYWRLSNKKPRISHRSRPPAINVAIRNGKISRWSLERLEIKSRASRRKRGIST